VIKGIFHLVNDVSAQAGDYLIMREDDYVAVVSRSQLDALFSATGAKKANKRNRKNDRAFGFWATAEDLEAARARGRHMAQARKQQLAEKRASQ
jgi:hypothetical protein